MNINAINQMMINKNLKFRAKEVPQEPQKPMGNTPEGPVTQPNEGLNALANNNIAFQGLNLSKVASKVAPGAKKAVFAAVGAAMLAPAAVSCTKEQPVIVERPPVNVEVNTTVNVDLDALTKLLELMIEQNELSREQMDALNEKLDKIITELEKNNDRDAAFQEQAYNLGLQILEQLIANNEQLAYLKDDVAAIKDIAANGDYLAALKEIQILLNEIKNEVASLKDNLNNFMKYFEGRDDKLFNLMLELKTQNEQKELSDAEYRNKMLALIAENRDITLKILEQQGMTRAEALAYLEKIVSQLNDANAKLDAIYAELSSIAGDVAKISEKQTAYHNQYMEMAKDADADREAMKEKLDLANYYLKELNGKVDIQNELLKGLEAEHGNITAEELKEILGTQSEEWQNFIEAQHNLYFGQLAQSAETLEYICSLSLEELRALNKKVMETNNLIQDQTNRFDQILAKIDWNQAQALGVAQEIRDLIAEFQFNCNCTCNGQGDKTEENEGILGDLDNIVNGNN